MWSILQARQWVLSCAWWTLCILVPVRLLLVSAAAAIAAPVAHPEDHDQQEGELEDEEGIELRLHSIAEHGTSASQHKHKNKTSAGTPHESCAERFLLRLGNQVWRFLARGDR